MNTLLLYFRSNFIWGTLYLVWMLFSRSGAKANPTLPLEKTYTQGGPSMTCFFVLILKSPSWLSQNLIFSEDKGQTISKGNYGLLNSPKKRTKCTQHGTRKHGCTNLQIFGTSPFADFEAFGTMCTCWFWGPEQFL